MNKNPKSFGNTYISIPNLMRFEYVEIKCRRFPSKRRGQYYTIDASVFVKTENNRLNSFTRKPTWIESELDEVYGGTLRHRPLPSTATENVEKTKTVLDDRRVDIGDIWRWKQRVCCSRPVLRNETKQDFRVNNCKRKLVPSLHSLDKGTNDIVDGERSRICCTEGENAFNGWEKWWRLLFGMLVWDSVRRLPRKR